MLAAMAPKIALRLGRLRVEFATAAELRDALLASFADASFAGGPFVIVNLDDARPAWSWTLDLLHQRTDWRPALGIALQHATHDGGDLARAALADLLANFRESVVLLEWTEPLARRWPDVRTNTAGTGWGGGGPNVRLADVVADQCSYLRDVVRADRPVVLDGLGSRGGPSIAELRDAADLDALLARTARRGRFYGADGPWSWLREELLFRAWLPDAMPEAVAGFATVSDRERCALLDWLGDGWDLWRFVDWLEDLRRAPPSWWSRPAKSKPAGWQRRIRPSHWPDVQTLGDVALEVLTRAHEQVATKPAIDLPPRP